MKVPEEAVEAVRKRQGFRLGSHSWEGLRPTIEANLNAAAPAIRAQERERIRKALLPRETTQVVARIDIEDALGSDD